MGKFSRKSGRSRFRSRRAARRPRRAFRKGSRSFKAKVRAIVKRTSPTELKYFDGTHFPQWAFGLVSSAGGAGAPNWWQSFLLNPIDQGVLRTNRIGDVYFIKRVMGTMRLNWATLVNTSSLQEDEPLHFRWMVVSTPNATVGADGTSSTFTMDMFVDDMDRIHSFLKPKTLSRNRILRMGSHKLNTSLVTAGVAIRQKDLHFSVKFPGGLLVRCSGAGSTYPVISKNQLWLVCMIQTNGQTYGSGSIVADLKYRVEFKD